MISKTLLSFVALAQAAHDIKDCEDFTDGLDVNSKQEYANAKCFSDLIIAANNDATDRTALVPKDVVVSMMPVFMEELKDVTIQIDGEVHASQHYMDWSLHTGGNYGDIGPLGEAVLNGELERNFPKSFDHFWNMKNSENIHFKGEGSIDGHGYMWWWREILQTKTHGSRPHMLWMSRISGLEMEGIKWINSPRYHIVPHEVENSYFHDFEIYCDIVGQFKLFDLFGGTQKAKSLGDEISLNQLGLSIEIPIPTFPLNTDGIDFSGRNATFRRLKITNFDDTVVPKPLHGGMWKGMDCTQDILVEDCEVVYGVGMTIGSVPPNEQTNCIKNVMFRNIDMKYPIKGIYVKPNPGYVGDGIIQNITYENVNMTHPIWWGIYIGPQQQSQPGGGGPGCMFYPLNPECETNPNVPMRDITLRNINIHGNILPAGLVRCNETNPCTGFVFENVHAHSLLWDLLEIPFITEFVYGTATNVYPKTFFLNEGEPVHLKDNSMQKYRTLLVQGIKLAGAMFGKEFLSSLFSQGVAHYQKTLMTSVVQDHADKLNYFQG